MCDPCIYIHTYISLSFSSLQYFSLSKLVEAYTMDGPEGVPFFLFTRYRNVGAFALCVRFPNRSGHSGSGHVSAGFTVFVTATASTGLL